MKTPPILNEPLKAIQQIASQLRDPDGGCPWDIEQTHQSLVKNLIEEAYETADAIEQLDGSDESWENMREELGDLLFQTVIHAQLADEIHKFNLNDIARYMCEKLIFRHPHVYGNLEGLGSADNTGQVLQNWERLKRKEKQKKEKKNGGERMSMLSGIPGNMPALLKALRMGQKTSRVGFDWPEGHEGARQLYEKIEEEIQELKTELSILDNAQIADDNMKIRAEEELGDLLFAVAQLGRRYQLDPEAALQRACVKFSKRFTAMENYFQKRLDSGEHPEIAEWEKQWDIVKKINPVKP